MALENYDVESVWERIKEYVDVGSLKGKNQKELAESIEDEMKRAGNAPEGKSGSMNNLINAGFAEAFAEKQSIQKEIFGKSLAELQRIEVERVMVKPAKAKPITYSRAGYASTKAGKVKIGSRRFSPSNLTFKESTWKGRKAVYVSSVRTGKRISWKLIK